MEKKKPVGLIATAIENVSTVNILPASPRLTPTGKISHAKTRVYTQRYRKEWEQMPDFKGWLTSVPFQPTRAYCTYCKKNLHAHRLSLLKHTCTMKHQRAALMHAAELKKKAALLKHREEGEITEMEEAHDSQHSQARADENEEEIEYIVERLEMDEDEMVESQIKEHEDVADEIEEVEENEEEDNIKLSMPSDEECNPTKKIKIEVTETCTDTLAEAMAHVHGEYLEESDEQGNLSMETVVVSDQSSASNVEEHNTMNTHEESNKESLKATQENDKSNSRSNLKIDKKKSTEEPKTQTDPGIVVTLPILGTAYQINSTAVVPSSGTIGVLQPINTLPIAPAQSKTITLTTGGKTLTLTGGTFQPGAQYVLSKFKPGKLPTLVMADKKQTITTTTTNTAESNQTVDIPKIVDLPKVSQEQTVAAVPSTSRQSLNKHVLLKQIKPLSKKPRISTHVMDTSKGLPIGGLQVSLYKLMDGRWTFLNESTTNANGRCNDLVDNMKVNFTAGRYKIHFDVDKYFTLRRIETIYPFIEIVFDVKNPAGYYHIPLLLSPFGYTTYRGSER